MKLFWITTCITISTLSLCANAATTQSAFSPIKADTANAQSGATVWTSGNGGVGGLSPTSWVEYANVDFGPTGASQFQTSVALVGNQTLSVHLDSVTGQVIAKPLLVSTGSWSTYTSQNGVAIPVSGIHNLFFTVSGGVNIASFQFTAAPAPKPSPSPSVVPRPSSSPTQYLGADILPVLNGAKPGQTIQLAKNGSYISSGMITVTASNVTVDLNGSTLALTSPNSSDILVKAPGFTIGNGHVTKALGVFVRSFADGTKLHDLVTDTITATTGVNQVFFGDVGSSNAQITNVVSGIGQTVGYYWTWDNAHFTNVTCKGSTKEYCFRQEVPSTGRLPAMSTLTGIDCMQLGTKDCIGIRMGSSTITNSVIHGDIRAGQNAATAPGSNVPSLVITNTVFDRASQTPQIAIDRGDIATVSNCTFYRADTHNAIAIDGQTTATLTNNVLHATVPGLTGMRLWSTIASPPPTVKETGTMSK